MVDAMSLKQLWIDLRVRWAALFRRRALQARADEELEFHLAMREQQMIEAGMPPTQAHAESRRRLGNTALIRDQTLDSWGYTVMDALRQDIRYAFRALRNHPGFAATAVLSLALGMGANTAIFSLFDALLLRTLPVRAPEELVIVTQRAGDFQTNMLSSRQREAFAASETLSGLCASRHWRVRVTRSGEAQLVETMLAAGNCFSLLGISAAAGRMFSEADDQAGDLVAVLSYSYWQRVFGGDSGIVGQTIDVQGRPFTIIGVTARRFTGLEPGTPAEIIVPLGAAPVVIPGLPFAARPDMGWLRLLGRRKPGASIEQVQADLTLRGSRIAQASKGKAKATSPRWEALPAGNGLGELRTQFSLPLRTLMGAVALVLLIACTNMASLLLARASGRRHEVDLRIALGAGRSRLLRQLLTESLVLSSLGGMLGLGIAWFAGPLLVQAMSRGRTPIVLDLSLDWRTLAFTAAISVLTGILFGIVPALRTTRERDRIGAQHGTRVKAGSRHWSAALIVSQVAVCVIVLVSAGLLLGSLRNLQRVDAGFRRDRVLLVGIRPQLSDYRGPRVPLLYKELSQRFAALPGVVSLTLSAQPPLGGLAITPGSYSINSVGSRFFQTMGIPLLAGREVDERDDASAPAVAVVSESVVRQFFPDGIALGRRMDVFGTECEIVGVVKDAHYQSLRQSADPMVYRPYRQTGDFDLKFGIRTVGDPEALTPLVRRELREVAPDVPIFSLSTLGDAVDSTLVRERMVSSLTVLFGGFALLIASIGLYGRLSYSVAERTGEIGVRMALGARQALVVWMVLKDALRLTLCGIALGVPVALASTRLIASLLFGVQPDDLSTFLMIVAAIVGVTGVAAYMPARRAASVNPLTALRHE